MKVVQSCFGTRSGWSMRNVSVSKGRQEGLIWSKDSGQYVFGKFSMSLVQANNLLEDQSQVESCALSTSGSRLFVTLVGIYDGHGGPEASRYINAHFFPNLERLILKHGLISEKVIKKAFQETEDGFFKIVANQWSVNPQLAAVGSCCLVGVVCNGTLYVANAGDSRAVMGRVEKGTGEVEAIQLSEEHNVSIESVRKELQLLHPDDPQIVIKKHGVWRVKGVIQVSRSIGDVYLKDSEYNKEPLYSKFRLRQPFSKPLLSSEPAVTVIKLQPVHRFIIFASDGLWEHFSNQEAVDMVQKHPVNGIAKRLIKAALQNAANKREMRYSDLMKIERGVRRHFHDDISVIVLFLDTNLMSRANSADSFPTPVSIKSVGANLRPNLLAPFSMPTDADT